MKLADDLLLDVLDLHKTNSDDPPRYEDTPWGEAHRTIKNSKGQNVIIGIVDSAIEYFNDLSLKHLDVCQYNCIEEDPETAKTSDKSFDPPERLEYLYHGTLVTKIMSALNHNIETNIKFKGKNYYTGPAPEATIFNYITTNECYQTVTSSITSALSQAIEYNKNNPANRIDILLIPCTENPTSPGWIPNNRKRKIKHSYRLKDADLLKFESEYSGYKCFIDALNTLELQGTIIVTSAGNYYDNKTEGFTAPAAFSHCFTIGAANIAQGGKVSLAEKSNRTNQNYLDKNYPYFITTLSPSSFAYPPHNQEKLSNVTPIFKIIDSTSCASAIFTGVLASYIGIKKAANIQTTPSTVRSILDKCTNITSDGYKILNITKLYQH